MKFASAILSIVCLGILFSLGVIPEKSYRNADFKIPDYYSQHDQDGDGVDDQTDILASARQYLATKPKYASKYYASGYPDDGYGVCTDVIAFALQGAGYDLQKLVDADIRQEPERYGIDMPDANIDFRRVQNLLVWFSEHAQNLTTNLAEISAWQGGDIVIFQNHIGLISDKRNRKGIPYLIHHYSPIQAQYEENTLERHAAEIVGHFRLSL